MQMWKRAMLTGSLLVIISIIILVINIFKDSIVLESIATCGAISGMAVIAISIFMDEED